MNTDKPDGYVNATDMTHAALSAGQSDGCGRIGKEAVACSAVNDEQEAKRIEKIRSHASSHHTAGTVRLDT